jgi:hypothetical protein
MTVATLVATPDPPAKPAPAPPTGPAGWQRRPYYRPEPADEE